MSQDALARIAAALELHPDKGAYPPVFRHPICVACAEPVPCLTRRALVGDDASHLTAEWQAAAFTGADPKNDWMERLIPAGGLQQERDSWAGRAQLLYADLKHAEVRLSRLLADLRGRNETWKRQGYTGLGINIDALLAQYEDVPAPDLGAGSTRP